MASSQPTFEVVGGTELSDAAISALAALLLDVADRAREQAAPQARDLASAELLAADQLDPCSPSETAQRRRGSQ